MPEKEDSHIVVKFPENAWCDEEIIYRKIPVLILHMWNISQSTFFGTNERRSRLLVYDQHKAQKTKKVKDILQNECKTTLVLVPT